MLEEKKSKHKVTQTRRKPKKAYAFIVFSIIFIVIILTGGLIWQDHMEQVSKYQEVELDIALITSNDSYNKDLYNKLNLDDGITVDQYKEQNIESNTLQNYDVVIVSNVDLSKQTRTYIANYIAASEDNSVIFLIDENTSGNDLEALNITNNNDLKRFNGDNEVGYGICKPTGEQEQLTDALEFDSIFGKEDTWNTMPEIYNYSILEVSDFYLNDAKDFDVVLKDYSSKDSDDVFLFYKDLEIGGQYLIFTIWFDAELNRKEITESWPYMGYFFYACYMFLEGEDIPTYRDWPYSPVPTVSEIILIAIIIGSLAISSFIIFIAAYLYSIKNPLPEITALETEEEIEAKKKALQKVEDLREQAEEDFNEEELDKLKKLKEAKEVYTFEEIEATLPDYCKGWEAVGLHRQVGGFWTIFFIALLLIIPAAAFFLWLFPAVIFPSPSGQGFYNFATNFFTAFWIFADLGTTNWMMRKFAAYRVSEPKKAISSAQCYLWFQVLSGAFQIILVGFLGAIGFPDTIYAHLTYVFVWYCLYQWLGFFMVYIQMINALQRVDVAGAGIAILAPLLLLVQMVIVPLSMQWGAANPRIGLALGGAIGASVANFVTNLGLFFVSWWIFRKVFVGSTGLTIFRVDFDWEMFSDMLKFGIKYAPGQALVPLVWTLQVILLSIYLDNYNNWLGYWNIAYTVVQVSVIIGAFAATLIPALSEAFENGKHTLVNYNIVSSLKWTNNFNFWISSAMFAISVPLVYALVPPEFKNVALLMPLLVLYQLLGPYSWVGDSVLAGMNHPTYATISWTVEQGLRAVLLIIFIPILAVDPQFGMFSVLFAYIPGLTLKNIFMWLLIKKKVVPELKIYWFKVFIAPAIAGLIFFVIIVAILNLMVFLTGSSLIGCLIAAVVAFVIGPFVYFFFSGLCGGWSEYDLEEFKRSTSIMSFAGRPSLWLYNCCRIGARISPWSEKGIIAIYPQARIEAWELTLEKKKIENF
ncbi:MAG: oligosaccharide flippase family protein [Promethearchaeota archaeon]